MARQLAAHGRMVHGKYVTVTQPQPERAKMETYKIVRHYMNKSNRVVARGLTLEEAQRHCNDPETSSHTATSAAARKRTRAYGPWFDGYYKE